MTVPAQSQARASDVPRGRAIEWLGHRWLTLLLVALAAPLTAYSIYCSMYWLGASFPSFLVMENRVVPSVSGYDWPPDKADVFHAQVIAVAGTAVSSSAAVYDAVAMRAPGTAIDYTFRKGGREFRSTVASQTFDLIDYVQVYGLLLLIGAMNLGLGATVGLLRPQNAQAQAYVILSFAGCCFAVTPVFLHQSGFPLLTVLYLAAESFFPAAFIQFALSFPVDRWHRSSPAGMSASSKAAIVYGVAAVLTIAKVRGFYADPPDLTALYLTYCYIALSFVCFLSLLAKAWREGEPRTRARIRTLIPVVTIGSALVIFAFLNNTLSGGNFPMQFGLLLVPVFYAVFAYAIVAHDLFGIDRFVRWTFVYALLTIAVYGAYTFVVSLAPTIAAAETRRGYATLGLAFVALALVLDPARRFLQRLVDRAYYRTPWSYRETVSRVSREMTAWHSVERIVAELMEVLTTEMQIETVTVWLVRDPAPWSRSAEAGVRRLPRRDGLPELAAVLSAAEPMFTSDLLARLADDRQRQPLTELFALVRAEIAIGLVFGGQLTGILLLGPTRARRPLHVDDVALLRTLADQAAVALENAASYEALERHNQELDQIVRQRTAQLMQSEQLASLGQLVAGIAHELNNPVGAVYSSIDNLRGQVVRLERLLALYEQTAGDDPRARERFAVLRAALSKEGGIDDIDELLDICSEGSQRIFGIVRDLLTFARADRGRRAPMNVSEALDSTVRLLTDRIESAGIRIVRDYRSPGSVEANAAQLNQVWMNLLTNAIDAVAGKGDAEIQLSIREEAAGQHELAGSRAGSEGRVISVEVRDNGAGMSDEVRAKIFEPFFTTKEIGRGTGLGMSIAYGVVQEHGGTIAVASVAGQGTTVTVRLPVTVGH